MFRVSTLGESFAVPRAGAPVVAMLRANQSSLRSLLAKEHYRRSGKTASQQALTDALQVIEGLAQESEPVPLHVRVARRDDGSIYLDLGDPTGRAVAIRAGEWRIVEQAPVFFKRTALIAALPEPTRDGTFAGLWNTLNVERCDQPLVLAWLVVALLADVPHPVLLLQGEHGTAKTTALKILVSLIDPSPVPVRKPPRDPEGWVTAAQGSWLVGLDNLSGVPDWLSDSICRAVTGDGDVRRRLYTNDEHAVFAFRRVIAITSIDLGALRGDLAERGLPISLRRIDEARRRTDSEMQTAWERMYPGVLGALLDLAAEVLKVLPTIRLSAKPRMADFADVLAAVDRVGGTQGFQAYLERQTALASDSLAGDAFIVRLMDRGSIKGTSASIYAELTPDKPPRSWPSDARAVTQRLHQHAPELRRAGWSVTNDDGRNHLNALVWTLIAPDGQESARKSSSPNSQDSQNCEDASLASLVSAPSPPDIRELDV